MNLQKLLELIREYEADYARPDSSGVRGGLERQPYPRTSNYPYDRDVTYGKPGAYDRGSGSASSLHGPLIPKDDSNFSLTILAKDEAPELLSRATTSSQGSSVPGVSPWSNDPPKPWDENDMIPECGDDMVDQPQPDFSREWNHQDNFDLSDPGMFAQMGSHLISPDPWSIITAALSSRGVHGLMPQQSAWDRVSGMARPKRENPYEF